MYNNDVELKEIDQRKQIRIAICGYNTNTVFVGLKSTKWRSTANIVLHSVIGATNPIIVWITDTQYTKTGI